MNKVYQFRVFVGDALKTEVADLLNESLLFRVYADPRKGEERFAGTVWGTVELPHDRWPANAFQDLTHEILGYPLPKPITIRCLTPNWTCS